MSKNSMTKLVIQLLILKDEGSIFIFKGIKRFAIKKRTGAG